MSGAADFLEGYRNGKLDKLWGRYSSYVRHCLPNEIGAEYKRGYETAQFCESGEYGRGTARQPYPNPPPPRVVEARPCSA